MSKDATISSTELRAALKQRFQLEMSDETAAAVIREFDQNGDGEISYGEFVQRLLGKDDIDVSGNRDGARQRSVQLLRLSAGASSEEWVWEEPTVPDGMASPTPRMGHGLHAISATRLLAFGGNMDAGHTNEVLLITLPPDGDATEGGAAEPGDDGEVEWDDV